MWGEIMTETKEKNLKEIIQDAQQHKCPVQQSLSLLEEFMAGPMCGRCLPCPMSCYEMFQICKNFAEGKGQQNELDAMKILAPNMDLASMCKSGKDTAKFIQNTLTDCNEKYIAHTEGKCPDGECKSLYTYRIIAENCTMCGECKTACKFDAIIGEKKVSYLVGYLPFEIAYKRCTNCGECIKVCNFGAIEIVDAKSIKQF
jgi:ferredoxin